MAVIQFRPNGTQEPAEEKRRAELGEVQQKGKKGFKKGILAISAVLALCLVIAAVLLWNRAMEPKRQYEHAMALYKDGKYDEAISAFRELDDYQDSAEKVREVTFKQVEMEITPANPAKAAIAFYKMGNYQDARVRSMKLWDEAAQRDVIAASVYHTVGLRNDGTVVAVGLNDEGQCEVSGWTDIVAVAADYKHTVGLRDDGTVVAVGYNKYGQCEVSDWRDIVAIAAGECHTVGLKADGTIMYAGMEHYGTVWFGYGDWTDIVAISSRYRHIVGLRSNGKVVATGYDEYNQCKVSGWKDIVAISAGTIHTVGLRADGTVVAMGKWDLYDDVSVWRDVAAISAGKFYTFALMQDGTVEAIGKKDIEARNVSDWKDIVAIYTGPEQTLGLKADGTVVAVGYNKYGQCEVSDWENIRLPN